MSTEAQIKGYWREELALIALLFIFFVGIVALSFNTPFDARLFPDRHRQCRHSVSRW